MDKQKDKIAIIANNQNLLDLLEESFLLYGKFSISIFANNLILDLIKKVDNISVLIISFIALIVIIDTFKSPIYKTFPNLEIVIFSLFEVLKDIELFIKDLI